MEKQTKKQAHKQNVRNFILYLIVCAIFLVIGFFIPNDWKYALFFLSAVAFGMAFYGLFNGIVRINRSFCPRCETLYSYDNYDVCWKEHSLTQNGTVAYSTVDFNCRCPKCKYEISFSKQFKCATFDKTFNTWEKRDVYDWAKKLFWHGLED